MMANPSGKIDFDHIGIGEILFRNRLAVPLNQREYAWEEKHVQELFHDFTKAITNANSAYFLGTIVLTDGGTEIPQVADGQQRLATTTILLAAIRDYLMEKGHADYSSSIESEFLQRFDRDAAANEPRLSLNAEDNEYFKRRILSHPKTPDRQYEAKRESHRKIDAAANLASRHVAAIIAPYNEKDRRDGLMKWVTFIQKTAKVIILKVPDDLNAFKMFETLNDRGLKTTQFDLVKNYLFGEVGAERAEQVHWKWSSMSGALESLGVDDISMTYLRHLLISIHGHVREREVFEKIQSSVRGKVDAIDFIEKLHENSNIYVSIINPSHARWNEYPAEIRNSLATINSLRVVMIRPLMLAVARKFPPNETSKAFRLLLACTVRFLIVGGGRSGSIEETYAEVARKVNIGEIQDAKSLTIALSVVVPTDERFKAEFATARVSQNYLARYYLRALESTKKALPEPELIPNDDPVINLEHILPQSSDTHWLHIPRETAAAYCKRLGNMVLLPSRINSKLGNEEFAVKKEAFSKSGLILTSMVADEIDWGVDQITKRQEVLAELAIKTWPLKIY